MDLIKCQQTKKNLNKQQFHWRFFHHHPHYHQQNCWGFHSEATVDTIVEGWDFHQLCPHIIPKATVNTIVEGSQKWCFLLNSVVGTSDESSKANGDSILKLQLTLQLKAGILIQHLRICSKIFTNKQRNKQKYNNNDHIMGLDGEN